jgi:hypothetical protein
MRPAVLAVALALAAPAAAAAQDAGRRALDAGVARVRDSGSRSPTERGDAGVDAGKDGSIEAGLRALPDPAADPDEPDPDEQADLPEEEETPLPEGHVPEVELRIEPREGLVTGDHVHVIVTVRVPENDDVAIPRQSFGTFELHDQRHRDREIDGDRRELTFEIDLLALEPGEQVLPSLRLRVVTEDGTVGFVRTEEQRITIGSLVANEPDAQPRPATRPLPVMQDDYTLAWVLGILAGMIATALVTWLVARWWSRRPKAAPPPPPPRPAWDVALAKLSLLNRESAKMIADGKQVELVDRTSDALREYLGARYDFNGLESTTDEVLARLKHAKLQSASLPEITTLLGDCDLVKFAKAVPTTEQCKDMIESAVKIVRATIPVAAPAIAPPSAPPAIRPQPDAPRPPPTNMRVVDRAGAVALPLVIDRADAVDAVVSAAVLGTVSSKRGDPGWNGEIVVAIAPELPDEYSTRQALRAVHEKLAAALAGEKVVGGAAVGLVIEHFHEPLREKGAAARKTVYAGAAPASSTTSSTSTGEGGGDRPTPTGNAFDRKEEP